MVQHQKSFEQNKKKCNNCKKRKRAAHQAYPQAEKIMCPLWFEEVYNRVLLSGVKTRAPSLTHYALACQKKKKKSNIKAQCTQHCSPPLQVMQYKKRITNAWRKKKKKKRRLANIMHTAHKRKKTKAQYLQAIFHLPVVC